MAAASVRRPAVVDSAKAKLPVDEEVNFMKKYAKPAAKPVNQGTVLRGTT